MKSPWEWKSETLFRVATLCFLLSMYSGLFGVMRVVLPGADNTWRVTVAWLIISTVCAVTSATLDGIWEGVALREIQEEGKSEWQKAREKEARDTPPTTPRTKDEHPWNGED